MDFSPIVTYLVEQGGLAILALILLWGLKNERDRSTALQSELTTLHREASAHVERLYQGRIESEGRMNVTVSEVSKTMEVMANSVEDLKEVVSASNESIRDLKQISQTNQEIGRELKLHLNQRRGE